MPSDAQIRSYMEGLLPTAQKVSVQTGIPANLLASWWSWETDAGSNLSSKNNNHAGINYTSNADYQKDGYAGYNSLDNFAKDFTRILTMGAYGYPEVIARAKKSPGDLEGITRAMNASSYAQDDYNVTEIVRRANLVSGGSSRPLTGFSSSGQPTLFGKEVWNPWGMNQEELLKFASIGAIAVLLISMTNEWAGE